MISEKLLEPSKHHFLLLPRCSRFHFCYTQLASQFFKLNDDDDDDEKCLLRVKRVSLMQKGNWKNELFAIPT